MLRRHTCCKRSDIFEALSQWRHANRKHVQSVIKVVTESSCPNLFAEIAVGRCDDTDIHIYGLSTTETLEFSLLQNAKQHHLSIRG